MQRRKAGDEYLASWFGPCPACRPVEPRFREIDARASVAKSRLAGSLAVEGGR